MFSSSNKNNNNNKNKNNNIYERLDISESQYDEAYPSEEVIIEAAENQYKEDAEKNKCCCDVFKLFSIFNICGMSKKNTDSVDGVEEKLEMKL